MPLKKKGTQALLLGLVGSTVISGGSYITGNTVGSQETLDQNWKGINQLQIPADFDETAKRVLNTRQADRISVYAIDYHAPKMEGVVFYQASSNKAVLTPTKGIPADYFVSLNSEQWQNDLRGRVTVKTDVDENDPKVIYNQFSSGISIDSLVLTAGRVTLGIKGKLTAEKKIELSDQTRALARGLKKYQ